LRARGQVAFALIPINALMTFFGLARNLGAGGRGPALIAPIRQARGAGPAGRHCGADGPRCLTLDPIGIYEWMGRTAEAPAYSPFGYGYTNYSRDGYLPLPAAVRRRARLRRERSRGHGDGRHRHRRQRLHPAPRCGRRLRLLDRGADCQKGPLLRRRAASPATPPPGRTTACNAACRDFFRNTRETLDTAWLRPRYDGYMGLQDRGGDIVHACLRGEASRAATLDALHAAYRGEPPHEDDAATPTGPLHGLVVLDFSQFLSGPLARSSSRIWARG
jgi:multiple sugar transport system substrate-binding protein